MPIPDSPTEDAWHGNIPGPGCSVEDLRWFCIRELGSLKETAKVNGTNLHRLGAKVEIMAGRLDAKAEAPQVQAEFGKLRQEIGTELGRVIAEADTAGINARLTSLAETANTFGAHVQEAFQHAKAVEASFQAHVSQGFSEAVTALQWLEGCANHKGEQVEQKIALLEAKTTYPPPPAPHAEARPARTVA